MPAKAETLLAIGESKYLSAGLYAEAVKGRTDSLKQPRNWYTLRWKVGS